MITENNLDNYYSIDDGGVGGGLDYTGKDGYVDPKWSPPDPIRYPVDPMPKEPVYPLPVDIVTFRDTDGMPPGDDTTGGIKPINLGDYVQFPTVNVGIDESTISKIVGIFCLVVIAVVLFVAKPFKRLF